MLNYFFGALLLIVSLCSSAANSAQLSQVNTQITDLTSELTQQKFNRQQLQESLQSAEISLGDLKKQQQQTNREIRKRRSALETLNQQQANYQNSLADLQYQLAQELRAAYMQEQPNYFKLILSQKNPNDLDRNLSYYQFVLAAQQKLIVDLNNTLTAIEENKQLIEDQTVQLLSFTNQQQQQIAQIQYKHQQRKIVLQALNQIILNKDQRLASLMSNKYALEHVVKQLEMSPSKPTQPWSSASFSQAKGSLNWPTRGKIVAGFNSSIAEGNLKLNGILFSAAEGQGVYAIAPGRVEFAQWMPGYGLLLIIDHGQGYMTLYGRNASLYKKVGDTVAAGDLIATVGRTGGYANPSLYFAIRKQGQPLDPMQWCGRRKIAA